MNSTDDESDEDDDDDEDDAGEDDENQPRALIENNFWNRKVSYIF